MYGMTEATRMRGGRIGMTAMIVVAAATLIVAGCGAPRSGGGNGTGGGGGTGTPCPPPPAAPGQDQQIHLVWQSGAWKVQLSGGQYQNAANYHSAIARCDGPTKFIIDVVGPNPPTFKDKGALDVWEGQNAKSTPQSGIHSTQILGPVIEKDGKLVFYDLNQGGAVTLNYQLNFNSGPSVDPIMDNGGSN